MSQRSKGKQQIVTLDFYSLENEHKNVFKLAGEGARAQQAFRCLSIIVKYK